MSRTNGAQYENVESSSSSESERESEASLRPEDIESDAGQVIEANHHQTNMREEETLSQGNKIFSCPTVR